MSQRTKAVWRNARAALLLLGTLGGSAAYAQIGAAVLTGNVVDASTKAPVADVVVTATSPSLQGEQVVVTDATGLYRVPQLTPGTYTLRFEKESYRPFSRTGIDVPADRTLRLNVELLPETAGTETVTVVGTPPTIDVGSSTTGTTVNQDFIRNIAVARPGGLAGANRSFDSLALAAPQAAADVYGISISGGQSPENQYLIDGLSVNNPAYGTLGSPMPADFIDEVNVLTGGYMPEYGRNFGGGTISATTKSGGNEFHGSVFGSFTPGGLAGTPRQVAATTLTISSSVAVGNIGDFGATLGGYIIKDRLWFFGGFDYAKQRYDYSRSFSSTADGTNFSPIPNSEQRRFGDEHTISYIGKLTYLISSDHRISVSVSGEPTKGGGDASYPLRNSVYGSASRAVTAPGGLAGTTFNASHLSSSFDNLDVVGELNSSFLDKKLLLDIRGGWHHQEDSLLPGDGSGINDIDNLNTLAGVPVVRTPAPNTSLLHWDASLPPSVVAACQPTTIGVEPCPVSTYFYGGPGFISDSTLDSYQGRGVLTYLLNAAGHHVLKAGVDVQYQKYKIQSTYTGFVGYRTTGTSASGGPAATLGYRVFDYRRYGVQTDVDVIDPSKAAAIIDKTVNSTIAGFFVQDSWSILDKVTLNLGLRYDSLTIKNNEGVVGVSLKDQWSPRIGVVWDPTQQGRAKIFANYGRYFENVPLDAANRSLSAETQIRSNHVCDPMQGHTGCDDPANLRIGRGVGISQFWANTGAPYPTPVDPDIKSPSTDEIVVGGEYEVIANARLGATWTHRDMHRTVEDMSTTGGATYFLGNPGEGIGNVFPKAVRKYDAVTVAFNKTFADLWLAQVSYTWSHLRGNYDGLFAPNYGPNQLDPNITAIFDFPQFLKNGSGDLSGDITHSVKAFLAKEFVVTPVFSFSLGGSLTGSSGIPIDALGADPVYGDGVVYILNRGTTGRAPWVFSFDAKVALNYRFTKDVVVTAAVDGFNLFNSQRPTAIDGRYTVEFPGPILGAQQGTIPSTYGAACPSGSTAAVDPLSCGSGNGFLPKPKIDPATGNGIRVVLPDPTNQTITVATNIRWGQATAYQAVRQFRFTLKVSF